MTDYSKTKLLMIAFVMCLTGGCSQNEQPSGYSDRQDTTMTFRQLSWARTGDLAMTRHSNADGGNVLLLSPEHDVTMIAGNIWQVDGWSDDGTGLLVEDNGSNTQSSRQLIVYNKKGQPITICSSPDEQLLCASWLKDDQIAYLSIPRLQNKFSVTITVKSESGHLVSLAELPPGFMPTYMTYVHQLDEIVIGTARLVGKRYRYQLNIWRTGKFFPVEGIEGSSLVTSSLYQSRLAVVINSSGGFSGIKSVSLGPDQITADPILDARQFAPHTEITSMSFSPDGSQLVISGISKLGTSNVYLYNFGSKSLTILAKGSMAVFSPEGKSVTYIGNGFGRYINSNEVYTIGLDGKNAKVLYRAAPALPILLIAGLTIPALIALFLWYRNKTRLKKLSQDC